MSQPAHNMNEEGIKKYNKISRYYTGLFLFKLCKFGRLLQHYYYTR